MKTYNETRYTLKYTTTNEKNEQVESLKVLKEEAAQKEIDEATKAGSPVPEVVKMQTFGYVEAETLADISTLVPDEAVAVDIWNRGGVLKQQGEIRDFMLSDEPVVDGVYSLQDALAAKTERRKATPAEKALKALSALSADEIAKILSQFQAASAA